MYCTQLGQNQSTETEGTRPKGLLDPKSRLKYLNHPSEKIQNDLRTKQDGAASESSFSSEGIVRRFSCKDIRHKSIDFGHWILQLRHWTLGFGYWILEFEH